MMRKPRIYPIFLPHWGCPFQCIYCNQHVVTSSTDQSKPEERLVPYIQERLTRLAEDAGQADLTGEIAFYGGTFTALPLDSLEEILAMTSPFIRNGVFSGVRFSTRPDGISPQVCNLLERFPIRTVELGVQSLSDEVLARSRRGYSSDTVRKAAAVIKRNGWALGIQLMLGLPGDTQQHFLHSVEDAIALRPDFVRIYPTLVLADTALAQWYREGTYEPLSLEEAILWTVPAYDALLGAGIPVARIGLHADEELRKPGRILAGPFHPAFGHLVRVYWWRNRVDRCLEADPLAARSKSITVRASHRSLSEVTGPRRINVSHWRERWQFREVKICGEPDFASGEFQYSLEE